MNLLTLMACCTDLAAISSFCGVNAKNLKAPIYIACRDDVATIPSETNHVISTDITMEATKLFYEWITSRATKATVTMEPQGDADSLSILTTITAFVPKIESAKTVIFNGILGGDHIIIFKDGNGEQRLLGDLDEGATITVTERSDDEKNGYDVEITWESAHYPYFYTGAITTS